MPRFDPAPEGKGGPGFKTRFEGECGFRWSPPARGRRLVEVVEAFLLSVLPQPREVGCRGSYQNPIFLRGGSGGGRRSGLIFW